MRTEVIFLREDNDVMRVLHRLTAPRYTPEIHFDNVNEGRLSTTDENYTISPHALRALIEQELLHPRRSNVYVVEDLDRMDEWEVEERQREEDALAVLSQHFPKRVPFNLLGYYVPKPGTAGQGGYIFSDVYGSRHRVSESDNVMSAPEESSLIKLADATFEIRKNL